MTYTPPEALVERVAEAVYEMDRVGVRPWADAPIATREDCIACASAALAATPLGELVEGLERLSRMLPAVLHGERDVVDLREIIDAALTRAKGEKP